MNVSRHAMKNFKLFYAFVLTGIFTTDTNAQYSSLKLSGGPAFVFSAFRNEEQSKLAGFSERTSYLGNINAEIQYHYRSRYLLSYGGSFFLNGYKYASQPRDSDIGRHTISASDYFIGLFSTAGYQVIKSQRSELAFYAGAKAAYGFSEFHLYIPVGTQIGFRSKGNSYAGLCIEYNLLLNPSYKELTYYIFSQPYLTEIRRVNNFINLTAYFSFPLVGK
jgi:hypothetical protein